MQGELSAKIFGDKDPRRRLVLQSCLFHSLRRVSLFVRRGRVIPCGWAMMFV